jgi:hypothetical protein
VSHRPASGAEGRRGRVPCAPPGHAVSCRAPGRSASCRAPAPSCTLPHAARRPAGRSPVGRAAGCALLGEPTVEPQQAAATEAQRARPLEAEAAATGPLDRRAHEAAERAGPRDAVPKLPGKGRPGGGRGAGAGAVCAARGGGVQTRGRQACLLWVPHAGVPPPAAAGPRVVAAARGLLRQLAPPCTARRAPPGRAPYEDRGMQRQRNATEKVSHFYSTQSSGAGKRCVVRGTGLRDRR